MLAEAALSHVLDPKACSKSPQKELMLFAQYIRTFATCQALPCCSLLACRHCRDVRLQLVAMHMGAAAPSQPGTAPFCCSYESRARQCQCSSWHQPMLHPSSSLLSSHAAVVVRCITLRGCRLLAPSYSVLPPNACINLQVA